MIATRSAILPFQVLKLLRFTLLTVQNHNALIIDPTFIMIESRRIKAQTYCLTLDQRALHRKTPTGDELVSHLDVHLRLEASVALPARSNVV